MADVGEELVSRRHQPVGDVAFANHVLVRRFALDGQEVCEEPGASRALLVELRIGVRALVFVASHFEGLPTLTIPA